MTNPATRRTNPPTAPRGARRRWRDDCQPPSSPPSIEDAITWITSCQQETSSVAKALRIGDYIIDRFYRDVDEARSRSPRKSTALRSLQKRLATAERSISAVALGNYVRVAAQERQLLASFRFSFFSDLSLTQRLVLTRIDDLEIKLALAERAIIERLTCKQLKASFAARGREMEEEEKALRSTHSGKQPFAIASSPANSARPASAGALLRR